MKKGKSLLFLMMLSLGVCGCADNSGNPSEISDEPETQTSSGSNENTLADIYDDSRPTGEQFDYESDYEKPEPPEDEPDIPPVTLVEDPAYKSGSVTSKYRLEGEWATNIVVEGSSTSSTWKNKHSFLNNTVFDFRFSNKLSTRNFNSGNNGKFDLTFTSNKSYVVKAKLLMSIWDTDRVPFVTDSYLSLTTSCGTQMFEGTNVTESVDLDDTTLMAEPVGVNNMYYRYATFDVKVGIFEGANKLTFNFLGGGGCNVDYIELDTSATITNINQTVVDSQNAYVEILDYPKESSAGQMKITETVDGSSNSMTYLLPALKTDGQLTNGYKQETVGGETLYYFEFLGKKYSVTLSENAKTTISIKQGSSVRFKGGATSIEKQVGDKLVASDFENDSGRPFEGIDIYSETGAFVETTTLADFVIPANPVTIDVTTYGVLDGFRRLAPGNEQNNGKPQSTSIGTGGGMPADNWSVVTGNKTKVKGGASGYVQLGNKFTYNTAATKDNYFRLNTVVNSSKAEVTMNTEHQFDWNVENLGTTAVHLHLNMINQQANVEPNDPGVDIDLEPGQSTTFIVKIKYTLGSANKNCLGLFHLTQDAPNGFAIGLTLAIKLGK